ncbi:MAG: hypothetical protein WCR08_09645 [Gammaproteobacteria bacterium]
MKGIQLIKNNILMVFLLTITTLSYAGTPVWTFTPLTATSISVPGNSTATIQYQVTNQSAKSHSLVMTPITGITQTTTGAGICSNPFTLPSKGSSCTLSLQVNGSQLTHSITDGPIVCEQGSTLQCYKPSPSNVLNINIGLNDTTLTESVATLGLSVNDLELNAALTGAPRVITISNSGTTTANNVACPTSGSASITSIVCTGCGTILAGQSCQVTITPSSTPSATAYVTNPTPITLSISGTNTNTLTPTINILTYGSVYQGGFVYEINDTTPNTGSIGGTVASLVDQAEPNINSGPQSTSIIWSSNGTASNVSYDLIPGIDETSSTSTGSPTYTAFSEYFQYIYTNTVAPPSSSFNECNGSTDGSCDTSNILAFYNTWLTNYSPSCDPNQGGSNLCTATSGLTTLTYYAAGLCTAPINGYSDWYLPAICEMDAEMDAVNTCPAGTQSMLGSLTALIGDPSATTPSTSCNPPAGTNCLAGYYWGSTENSGNPQDNAWNEYFASGGGSNQNNNDKSNTLGARCSRGFK